MIVGGQWAVDNAVLLARQAGMSEALIGLTLSPSAPGFRSW